MDFGRLYLSFIATTPNLECRLVSLRSRGHSSTKGASLASLTVVHVALGLLRWCHRSTPFHLWSISSTCGVFNPPLNEGFGASQVALVVKNLPANSGDVRDASLIPGSGRSPGGGHGNPLQYSCLENPMDRGAWRATVPGLSRSRTWLSD